jgi:GGDEF domain-containing protein
MPSLHALVKDHVDMEVRKFACISNRYDLPFCLMLLYSDTPKDITEIVQSNTRCADRFIKINDHYHALLFFANKPDSHAKVANKILYALEKMFPASKISIGIACQEKQGSQDILTQAVQNLLLAKESTTNTIIDNF